MARSKPNPRQADGAARRRVERQVYREESDCWICGQPVDMTLRWPDPMSRSIDEVVPVSLGGSPFDRANCRLAHLRCNQRRGAGRPVRQGTQPIIETSCDWQGG